MNISDERKAYKLLIKSGLTEQGACGLIGNLEAERTVSMQTAWNIYVLSVWKR